MQKQKQIGDYVLIQRIGKGNFSTVYLAVKKEIEGTKQDNKKYAIKQNPVLQKLLSTEVSIMNKINHKNIMHLYDYLETENNYYLVIDYCEKGDLESFLRKKKIRYLDEKEVIYIMKQIANAFVELHKYNVMHRDIKLANIFVHQNKIVVGDFGFAKTGQEMAGTALGTPITMAPEMIIGETDYSSKADLWSIGVVFYQLLQGQPPFFGLSLRELLEDINLKAGKNLKFSKDIKISQETKSLLQKILTKNPDKRIGWLDFFNSKVFKQKYNQSQLEIAKQPLSSNSDQSVQQDESFLIVKEQNQKVLQEFDLNKDKSSVKKTHVFQIKQQQQFLSPCKVEQKQNFQSSVNNDEVIRYLYQEQRNKENQYRYQHEINKISFIMKTCKLIITEIINNNIEKEHRDLLYKMMLYQAQIAKNKSQELLTKLIIKENTYNVYDFQNFVCSKNYELLIDLCQQTKQIIKDFYKLMIQENEIFTEIEAMGLFELFCSNIDQKNAEQLLKESIYYYQNDILSVNSIANSSRQKLLLINYSLVSLRIDKLIPYWVENEKFNWQNFTQNYQNMNKAKLVEIIKYSFQLIITKIIIYGLILYGKIKRIK